MSETVLKYSCPSCGAPLKFDANTQKLLCDSCESVFTESYFDNLEENEKGLKEGESVETIQKVDWKTEGFAEKHEILEDLEGYSCNSCGAEVATDKNTVATECMYCGNALVVAPRIDDRLKPDLIIPFKIDKEKAESLLKEFYKGKKLLPKEFLDKSRISKIAGMYVPFWLFNCKGEGSARFIGNRVSSYSDSRYRYTKTRTYSLHRTGNVSFQNISIDASSKLEDNYMDGLEPYNFREAVDFNDAYMAGYFADKFDIDVNESSKRASERVIASAIEQLENTTGTYSAKRLDYSDIKMTGEEIKYALLPVWMLNTKYKGKMYQFAINGQTGKVSGELPIDKNKQKLLLLSVFTAILIPATIFAALII